MQGYDRTKPEFQSGLNSEVLRTQFNAVATANEGPAEPIDKPNGLFWLDTATHPENWILKMRTPKGWEALFEQLNAPTGYPQAKGQATSYIHTQASPALVWNINHNLNKLVPNVTATDLGAPPQRVDDDSYGIQYTDVNNLVITFTVPMTGKAYLE